MPLHMQQLHTFSKQQQIITLKCRYQTNVKSDYRYHNIFKEYVLAVPNGRNFRNKLFVCNVL